MPPKSVKKIPASEDVLETYTNAYIHAEFCILPRGCMLVIADSTRRLAPCTIPTRIDHVSHNASSLDEHHLRMQSFILVTSSLKVQHYQTGEWLRAVSRLSLQSLGMYRCRCSALGGRTALHLQLGLLHHREGRPRLSKAVAFRMLQLLS